MVCLCKCYFFDKLRKTASAKILLAYPLYATIEALEQPSIPKSDHYKIPKVIAQFFSAFPNEKIATAYRFNFKLIWFEQFIIRILLMANSNGADNESLEPRSRTLKTRLKKIASLQAHFLFFTIRCIRSNLYTNLYKWSI